MANLVMGIPVRVHIVLGTAQLTVAELSRLAVDSLIELDRRIGEPVDLLVNGRPVARGEIVVVDRDAGRLGIRVVEITGAPAAAGLV